MRGFVGGWPSGLAYLQQRRSGSEPASTDGGSRKLPDLRARQSAVSWCGGCV